MNNEEMLQNTEILEETSAETLVDSSQTIELLTNIRDDVHVIMVFTIITFCMACFRGWRKNVVKGVR